MVELLAAPMFLYINVLVVHVFTSTYWYILFDGFFFLPDKLFNLFHSRSLRSVTFYIFSHYCFLDSATFHLNINFGFGTIEVHYLIDKMYEDGTEADMKIISEILQNIIQNPSEDKQRLI